MHRHTETRILPYTTEQLYTLVADIEHYPEFLPWCKSARILSREQASFTGELTVCFKGMCQSYVSRIHGKPPASRHLATSLHVVQMRGPFTHLVNDWQFTPVEEKEREEKATEIRFMLEFAFKSKVLDKIIGLLFHKATRKMVEAFEERAKTLYGDKCE